MSDTLSFYGRQLNGVIGLKVQNTLGETKTYVNTFGANATSNDILSGKIAYVNGSKITGNIAFKPAETYTPGTINQIISSNQYLSENQTILGDVNLISDNIKSNITIFGITGTMSVAAGLTDFFTNRSTFRYYSWNDSSITQTTNGAFNNVPLSTASLPKCTIISPNTFASTHISSIYAPLCTTIGTNAFYYCYTLSSVSFPACTIIHDNAFYSTRLSSVKFSLCSIIGEDAFGNCTSLASVYFSKCTIIGSHAFQYCNNLITISFPICITIYNYAFNRCIRLSSINFPVCTEINLAGFQSCSSLQTAIFPSCSIIGSYAFSGCYSLAQISFPKCTRIYSRAFYSCSSLTTASFPECSAIGYSAFQYCINLKSLYLMSTSFVELSGSQVFSSTPIGGYSTAAGVLGKIYVPKSLFASYKTRTNWTYFSARFVSV